MDETKQQLLTMPTLLESLPPARPAELHATSIAKTISGKLCPSYNNWPGASCDHPC